MNHNPAPPFVALHILHLLVPRADRETLIGDMHEAYGDTARRSQWEASRWYWRQTLQSIPSMVMQRINTAGNRQHAATASVALLAFMLITAWDALIVTVSLPEQVGTISSSTLFHHRAWLFLFHTLWVIAVGGAITFIASHLINMSHILRACFYSVIGMLTLSVGYSYMFAEASQPAVYMMMRVGVAMPSLFLGACIAAKLAKANLLRR